MSDQEKNTHLQRALSALQEYGVNHVPSKSVNHEILNQPELLEQLVYKFSQLGCTMKDIITIIGVPESTFYYHVKAFVVLDDQGQPLIGDDGKPLNKLTEARRRGLLSMRTALRGTLIGKALDGDVGALKLALQNLDRSVFYEQRIDKLEIEGKVKHTGAIASTDIPYADFIELCRKQNEVKKQSVDEILLEATAQQVD